MKLRRMMLKNFKGVKSFMLEPNGQDLSIYGDNATGKTTLYDGFTWLLFGKDSLNRADFEIKTLQSGSPEHGLEHEVEAVLDVDGRELVLKKVLTENWTKKRGSTTKEFTGHSVEHWVDGVPRKKKEFDSSISEIADEVTFWMLTDPRYFNERLSWQDRRKRLIEICGDVDDSSVIQGHPEFSELSDILKGRPIDDHRKVIAGRRKKINEQLEKIPVRIDECKAGVADVADLDPKTVSARIAHLQSDRKAKAEELVRIDTGGEVARKTKELCEVEAKIQALENKGRVAGLEKYDELQRKIWAEQNTLKSLQRDHDEKERVVRTCRSVIEDLDKKMEALRSEYSEIDGRTFICNQAEVCPTCGQAIPEAQMAEARRNALDAFNSIKAAGLADIQKRGKAHKAEKENLQAELEKTQQEALKLQGEMRAVAEKVSRLETDAKAAMKQVGPIDGVAELVERKNELESAISELQIGSHDAIAEVKASIEGIDAEISEQQALMAKRDLAEQAQKRFNDLKKQERELAAEFERLEKELYLCESFVRTKVRELEERINSRFALCTWRMFEDQINGGLQEVCECLVDGVPYGSMNNAARINAGLDICNTLSRHYGITTPTFIDNAESVTELLRTEAQQIRLIVSAQHKTLTAIDHDFDEVFAKASGE